ncbi:MAG: hypothetical protein A3J75_06980 [Acidobacteria bacterium RBG_16_68_9]|nr:MAG: hypothetical protein A3J75_06980 [Acidobacteria bacterium RBG_16_68_9]
MRAAAHACVSILGVVVVGLAGCSTVRYQDAPKLDRQAAARRVIGLSHGPVLGPGPEPSKAPPRVENKTAIESQFETAHPRVQHFLDAYQADLRPFMRRSLERGGRYLPQIASILAEEGIPQELAYLPIVESGFRIDAVSHAGAVGPWQFIRGTGRRYGLRIDGYVDERRDPEKATRAAARYLRDLYDMFDDWHLSLAAYNTGEANVARVRSRLQTDSFWEMSDRGHLPVETREFVPRFLAAMEIARAPEDYGFDLAPAAALRYDQIRIDRVMSLKTVAKLSRSRLSDVTDLNPALRRGVVPPQGYVVRLPKGTRRTFELAYARMQTAAAVVVSAVSRLTHRVRRGETPSSIAQTYGVSVTTLMRANRIRNPRALQVGQMLSIPGGKRSERPEVVASSARRPRSRTVN